MSVIERKGAPNSSNTAVTLSFDETPAAGERLIAFWRSSLNQAPVLPDGWSEVASNAGGGSSNAPHMRVFTKVAGGAEDNNYVFDRFEGNPGAQLIIGYRLLPAPEFIGSTATGTRASDVVSLAIGDAQTSMSAGSLALAFLAVNGGPVESLGFSDGYSLAASQDGIAFIAEKSLLGGGDEQTVASWSGEARAGGILVEVLSAVDMAPSIGPISTDDTVTQGETGITFRVSGLTSAPTSVTLNGVSLAFTHEMVIGGEGDIDITLTDPIPLNLEDGSYDLVVSNDDETATKSIGYVVTHPVALPDPGEYDSNSPLAGVGTSFPAGSYAQMPIIFTPTGAGSPITVTFKSPYTSWLDADLTLSLDDIIQAPAGVSGEFSATAEALFPDGTTDTWTITLDVQEEVEEPVDPQAPEFVGHINSQIGLIGDEVSLDVSVNFTGATGYSASGLPAGLSINTSTGLISGTLTDAEQASVTVTATNDEGSADSNAFGWKVLAEAPPRTTSRVLMGPVFNPVIAEF